MPKYVTFIAITSFALFKYKHIRHKDAVKKIAK